MRRVLSPGLALERPSSIETLHEVEGVSEAFVSKHGTAIIDAIQEFCALPSNSLTVMDSFRSVQSQESYKPQEQSQSSDKKRKAPGWMLPGRSAAAKTSSIHNEAPPPYQQRVSAQPSNGDGCMSSHPTGGTGGGMSSQPAAERRRQQPSWMSQGSSSQPARAAPGGA
ncbi:hypothetical protein T484DRAFT_1796746, partial [Baffinella frigidus]